MCLPTEESPPKAKLSKFGQIQVISSCYTPPNLVCCNINQSALATCSLVLWKLEITAFQNFTFWVISLTSEKKLLLELLLLVYHIHISSFYLFISTILLKEKKWLLRTSGLFFLGFHIVKINSGYQLQFQRLSRRVKKKTRAGVRKIKAGSAAWLWCWPKKMVKKSIF